jgi:hypothetical protein
MPRLSAWRARVARRLSRRGRCGQPYPPGPIADTTRLGHPSRGSGSAHPRPNRGDRQGRPVLATAAHRELRREIFGRLARGGYLRGRDQKAFVAGLAEHLGDVNALHPFREGNGRAQRAFVSQLARDAGYLHRERADPARNVEASIASLRGDTRLLRELLSEVTEPRPAAEAEGEPRPGAGRKLGESELAERTSRRRWANAGAVGRAEFVQCLRHELEAPTCDLSPR